MGELEQKFIGVQNGHKLECAKDFRSLNFLGDSNICWHGAPNEHLFNVYTSSDVFFEDNCMDELQ